MKVLFSLLVVLASVSLQSAAGFADTGTSHNFFYLDKIDDRKSFVARGNLVTRDGFEDFFFGYADAGLRFKIDGSWSFEAAYRHAYLELADGWRQEYRPHLNLAYRGKAGEWGFRNRHRLEFRYFEGDAKNRIRYRNESVWTAPYKTSRHALTPYVSEEFFYDVTDHELNINWLTIGVSKPFASGKKWKLGYRLQHQKFGDDWSTRHILVTGISILNFD
jgi:hypothetical protein